MEDSPIKLIALAPAFFTIFPQKQEVEQVNYPLKPHFISRYKVGQVNGPIDRKHPLHVILVELKAPFLFNCAGRKFKRALIGFEYSLLNVHIELLEVQGVEILKLLA